MSRTVAAVLLVSGGLSLVACVPTPPRPTIKVTTTADVVADDGVTSLREAFAQANGDDIDDTIELVAGATYDLTDCTAGALVHTTLSSLTVVGDPASRATIHQTCTDAGILRSALEDSSLTVRGATLAGGPGSGATRHGAGIHVAGLLVVEDSSVTGVDAGPDGTVVEGNSGGEEPQPGVQPTDLTFTRSSVHDNTGTAMQITHGRVELESTQISDNVGDGIRLDGRSSLRANDATVTGHSGWGIYQTGSGSAPLLDFDFGDISDNAAGGVLCSHCLNVRIWGSTIDQNGAGATVGSGGGVVLLVSAPFTGARPFLQIANTRVTNNRAQRAGGGVFVGYGGSADPDGDALTYLGLTEVSGNITTGDNQHGGGVAVSVGSLELFQTSVSSNVAGGAGSDGGGVYLQDSPLSDLDPATFVSEGSDLTGNSASGRGGGAYVDAGASGSGSIETSSFEGNQATEGGGLFAGPTSHLSIGRSTFATNTASVQGGGIAAEEAHGLEVTESTVSGNSAPLGGGLSIAGDPSIGSVPLTQVTVTANSAPVGANVAISGGVLQTFASLLVEPLGGGSSCAAVPASLSPQGYSFVADASCGIHATDTVTAGDLQLGPLADNGGRTRTRLPAPTSPIIDTVPIDVCTSDADQREVARPQGPGCEPGSVEVEVETEP